jgi:hypothetical protein
MLNKEYPPRFLIHHPSFLRCCGAAPLSPRHCNAKKHPLTCDTAHRIIAEAKFQGTLNEGCPDFIGKGVQYYEPWCSKSSICRRMMICHLGRWHYIYSSDSSSISIAPICFFKKSCKGL